ncbi:flavodoxin family protein [Paenibacillus segetis]|uniref:NAD(P)H-dependent oxidoreductase n=1 Tax=Paenibacillus segetis TaxID=1325360 RepID=A0ABQ1YSU4_9BACL|nr:flavodoxin family protein [Paenibacillus segetis]GGH37525.1 NAD(P)H-dependent oxidoreductase [Paenibacillus segetis]
MSIAVLHGSTRDGGNTEGLAQLVLDGIPHTEIKLRDKKILPIHDQRHDEGGFDAVDDDYDEIIREVLKHDVLVFTSPVYWYGISGTLKNFIDRWSQSLRDSSYDFKGTIAQKKAYVIVVGGDNPRIKALPLILQLKHTFDFVGLGFEGYIIGKASKPGDIVNDSRAAVEAAWLNDELKAQV